MAFAHTFSPPLNPSAAAVNSNPAVDLFLEFVSNGLQYEIIGDDHVVRVPKVFYHSFSLWSLDGGV